MAKTPKTVKMRLDADTIMVALDMLDPSPVNVRKTHRDADIESLAANIAGEGLLQNLGVTASVGTGGEPTGRYEVSAGERRRLALLLLVGQKRLAKNEPVPCRLVARDNAASASLSENTQRVAMHPADQYEAFASLNDGGRGLTVAQIAERHGVSEHTVKQRLRLGSASPLLMAAFRAGTLSLAHLMAYCVVDDQAAQERVFKAMHQGAGWVSEYAIRRALLEDKVPLNDRRIKAIGLDAYTAAGGSIVRDLFSTDGDGWATDVDLLNRLASEKLETAAGAVRAEGWAWVVVAASMPSDLFSYRRKAPEHVSLSPEDDARLTELGEQYDQVAIEQEGELTDEDSAKLERIEAEIGAIQARRDYYSPEVRAQSGAFVTLGGTGVEIECGWVRPEDPQARPGHEEPTGDDAEREEAERHEGRAGHGGSAEQAVKTPALSDALTAELLAQRTAALQVEVARRPDLALRVLLHSLLLHTSHRGYAAPCKVSINGPHLKAVCPAIDDTPASKELSAHKGLIAAWKLPEEGELLPWLMTRDNGQVLEMLAVLIASGINAGQADWTTPKGANDPAAQIADLALLDMNQWWQPTTESYFGRVPKSAILEAMAEGAPEVNVSRSGSEKKADTAAAATALLDGKGWLPKLLRTKAWAASRPEAPEQDRPQLTEAA